MKLGIDTLITKHIDLIKNKKVALLSHAAAVNKTFESTLKILWDHPDIHLVKLFAPEHGFYATAQDMESVDHETDPLTGLPIVSLYGSTIDTLKPKKDDLKNIDVLICDLQDIGTRYYTFIYTIALCMEVCAKLKIPVIVLDRPNPLNGVTIEGNILDPKFSSFVGLYPLPVRHGMTVGELARYFNGSQNLKCDLTIMPVVGWDRNHYFDEAGVSFVAPSPNMPTLSTALVYPGMCLIEATEVSEARGTTKPFEWVGAPYIHAQRFANNLNRLNLPGIIFRPLHFTPKFQKWAREECHGVELHVTDRKLFKPYQTGLRIVATLLEKHPFNFTWRDKPYEFVTDLPAIDLLTGGAEFRNLVVGKKSIDEFVSSFEDDENEFRSIREKFLIYE